MAMIFSGARRLGLPLAGVVVFVGVLAATAGFGVRTGCDGLVRPD